MPEIRQKVVGMHNKKLEIFSARLFRVQGEMKQGKSKGQLQLAATNFMVIFCDCIKIAQNVIANPFRVKQSTVGFSYLRLLRSSQGRIKLALSHAVTARTSQLQIPTFIIRHYSFCEKKAVGTPNY